MRRSRGSSSSKLDAMLTELTDEQAKYIGLPKDGPLQARALPLLANRSVPARRDAPSCSPRTRARRCAADGSTRSRTCGDGRVQPTRSDLQRLRRRTERAGTGLSRQHESMVMPLARMNLDSRVMWPSPSVAVLRYSPGRRRRGLHCRQAALHQPRYGHGAARPVAGAPGRWQGGYYLPAGLRTRSTMLEDSRYDCFETGSRRCRARTPRSTWTGSARASSQPDRCRGAAVAPAPTRTRSRRRRGFST